MLKYDINDDNIYTLHRLHKLGTRYSLKQRKAYIWEICYATSCNHYWHTFWLECIQLQLTIWSSKHLNMLTVSRSTKFLYALLTQNPTFRMATGMCSLFKNVSTKLYVYFKCWYSNSSSIIQHIFYRIKVWFKNNPSIHSLVFLSTNKEFLYQFSSSYRQLS
jgi:hypothetical protein